MHEPVTIKGLRGTGEKNLYFQVKDNAKTYVVTDQNPAFVAMVMHAYQSRQQIRVEAVSIPDGYEKVIDCYLGNWG